MKGRIKSVNHAVAEGSIKSDDDLNFSFEFAVVLDYDVAYLTVGQNVTFDLAPGDSSRAVNVRTTRSHEAAAPKSAQGISGLRYMGFDQSNSLRVYRYEAIFAGSEKRNFTVTADLGLFTKNHIAIQDGPILCLRVLTAELETAGVEGNANSEWSLTQKHLLAHTVNQPAATPRPRHAPRDSIYSHLV